VGSASAEEANQICIRYKNEIARLGEPPAAAEGFTSTGGEGMRARAALADYGKAVTAAYKSALAGIRGIEPPAEKADSWTVWLRAFDSRLAAQRDRHEAVLALEAVSRQGGSAEARSVQQRLTDANALITAALQRSDDLAREVGAARCVGVI
jgi:hypothetical protein